MAPTYIPQASLQGIPTELRLKILLLLLGPPFDPKYCVFDFTYFAAHCRTQDLQTLDDARSLDARPVALVNKQLYAETMGLQYSRSSVTIDASNLKEPFTFRFVTSVRPTDDKGVWPFVRHLSLEVLLRREYRARERLVERLHSFVVVAMECGRRLKSLEIKVCKDVNVGMPTWLREVLQVLDRFEVDGDVKVSFRHGWETDSDFDDVCIALKEKITGQRPIPGVSEEVAGRGAAVETGGQGL